MKKAKVKLKKYIYGGTDDTQNTAYQGSNVANLSTYKPTIAAPVQNNLQNTSTQQLTEGNQAIDSNASSVPVYGQVYGLAKGASNIGKNFIKTNEDGSIKTANGRVANDWLTPDHELIMNGYKQDGLKGALRESSGMGKIGRTVSNLTGHYGDTSGNWGRFNNLVGIKNNAVEDAQAQASYNYQSNPLIDRDPAYFANGGINITPNAEVERQENSITPSGEFTQYNGPSHEQGGISTNLESGEIVFSDKLKLPGTKKTFADLNKPFNTNKEDKILEDKKKGSIQKATADLMKAAKIKQSMDLFNQQESLKEAKLASYAQKLGVNSSKFAFGGTNPSPTGQPISSAGSFSKLTDAQLRSSWLQHPNYNGKPYYTKMEVSQAPNGKPFYNYNFYSTDPVQTPLQSQVTNNPPIVQDPMKQVGFNGMQAPIVESYKNGGIKKYPWGGTEDDTYGMEAPNYISPNGINYYGSDNNSGINSNSLVLEDYNQGNYAFENANRGGTNNTTMLSGTNPGYTPTSSQRSPRDYSQLLNLGTTAVAGIAANIGNMYDLKRSKTVDKETYNRVTPQLLDPTATLRYNDQVFAKGSQDVKNSSNGNSSTYIQNRKDLAINQMLTNARIRQDYANQNASILNQSKYYNAGTGDKETIANLMNQAQARNIKGVALASIGNNVSNSITGSVRDANMSKRDKDYLKIIAAKYPEILKDPELSKLYK